MTRNGKIARLPLAVRLELNQRLQDGQKGRQLVAWLNGLPEVQAVMSAEFDGQPIAEYNLSRWKNGGYQAWEEEQQAREGAAALMEDSPGLQGAGKEGLTEQVALLLNVRMALEINELDRMPNSARKSKKWRELLGRFAVLRRGELQAERIRLESEKIGFRRELSTH